MITATAAYTAENESLQRTPVYRLTMGGFSFSNGPCMENYYGAVLLDSPIGYWRLGESSGTSAADSSGNGLTGTYENTPTLGVTGPHVQDSNTAVTFASASSEDVTIPDNALFDTASISVEAWFKSTDTDGIIVGKSDGSYRGYTLQINTSKIRWLHVTAASATVFDLFETGASNDGAWHHVVGTWDGTTGTGKVKLYVDGVLNGTATAGAGTNLNNAHVVGIAGVPSVGNYLDGTIDEVAIYTHVLSANRVRLHYSASKMLMQRGTVLPYLRSPRSLAAQIDPYKGRSSVSSLVVVLDDISNYQTEVLVDSPAVFLRLGELYGTAAQDTGPNNLEGTYVGDLLLGESGALTGNADTAVTLDGSTQYVTVADNALIDHGDTFTLECWAKFDSVGAGTDPLFDKGTNGYYLYRSTASLILAKKGTADIVTASVSLTAGAWTYIVATKSGATVRLYINGTDVTGSVSNQTCASTATALFLGQDSGATTWLAGSLDEVAVYPTALSGGAVKAHYESGLYGKGVNGAITKLISADIINGSAVFDIGFAGIRLADYCMGFFTGTVDTYRLTADMAGYEITCRAILGSANKPLFRIASTNLYAAINASATSMNLTDARDLLAAGYVAIDSEIIQYSGSGLTGSPQPSSWWRGLAFNGAVLVGVSRPGTTSPAATSVDGAVWITRTPAAASGWNDVCWAAALGLFCAVAGDSADCVMTSPDGITWTLRTPAAVKDWEAVAWSPSLSLFAAVSSDSTNVIMTSPDGITWTTRTTPTLLSAAIAWSPDLAIFTTCNMSSTDGITWTDRTGTGGVAAEDIAWSPALGLFVAVIGGANAKSSPDGITWTTRTAAASGSWSSVDWSPALAMFAAVGYPELIMTSTNGTTWTSRTVPNAAWLYSVVWASELGKFVALPNDSGGIVSVDGITWTQHTCTLTGLTRGKFSTTAASHSAAATVSELLYYTGHILDILLLWLENTDKSGLSIAAANIDTAGIAAIKAELGDCQATYYIREERNAKEWIEDEINLVLGMYPVLSGKYSIHYGVALDIADSVDTITHDDIVFSDDGRPLITWDGNFTSSVYNVIVFNFDKGVLTDTYATSLKFENAASIALYGRRQLTISSQGLKSLSSGSTLDRIEDIADRYIARYADGSRLITIQTFLRKALLSPGDIVSVTSSVIPNRTTGKRGVTNVPMEIINSELMFDTGIVQLTLLDVT